MASSWLGVSALLLVCVPLTRVFGLVAALVGLTLGIVALVGARRARAAGRRDGRGHAGAGVALSGVAFLLGLVATISSVVAGVQEGMAALPDPAATGAESSARPGPQGSAPDPSGTDPFGPALLPIGTSGTVGDHEVTVTAVTPRTSTLYDPTTEDSQTYSYLQVDLVLTNRGPGVLAPLDEVRQVLVTPDDEQHTGTGCVQALAVTEAPVADLQPGQTTTATVCVDVPADQGVSGGQYFLVGGDEANPADVQFVGWAVPPWPSR